MFTFAGGEPAFRALAEAHHRRCLDDPVLSHPFSHPGNPEHIQRLADYWTEVFGGPARYAPFGGHPRCSPSTATRAPTTTSGTGSCGRSCGRPTTPACRDDPAFRASLRAYMEWAVAEVLSYSPKDAEVAPALPTPHWGWDGLE